MLAKKLRLTLADPNTRELFRSGRRWRGAFFSAHFDFLGADGDSLVGLVVPKSVIPRAVDRTRVRRALYDAVGKHLQSRKNMRLVLRVHSPKIADQPTKLDDQIRQLFEEISDVKKR